MTYDKYRRVIRATETAFTYIRNHEEGLGRPVNFEACSACLFVLNALDRIADTDLGETT